MKMLRPATMKDVGEITELAMEAASVYGDFLPSREKIRRMATVAISSAKNFAWVSVVGGEIVGAIGAFVDEMPWAERKRAVVSMWYCRGSNEGVALLRELIRWVRSRRGIKALILAVDFPCEPRVFTVLERMGLAPRGPLFAMVN